MQKAFEIYGNPLPDIIDLRIEKSCPLFLVMALP
jgi:DNA polymerase III alpha subunit (gram-positive type)